jgi:hypothetical protein
MFLAFPAIGPWEFWKWMFPHVALVFGFISFHQFLMIAAFAFSLVALFFTTYLIVAQLFCLARGQTRVEYLMVEFALFIWSFIDALFYRIFALMTSASSKILIKDLATIGYSPYSHLLPHHHSNLMDFHSQQEKWNK